MQILNLNTKTIENKHFIHYLKRFCPFGFVMPTSKHKYQCFYILVQSFRACTFSRIYELMVSNTNFHQFRHTFPFQMAQTRSKTAQLQNKMTFTETRSQECSPTNSHQPTKLFLARYHRDFCTDWLVCIAYYIFWHLSGSDQLSYFSSITQFAIL